MPVRLQQFLIVVLALVLAAAMVWLGLWQLRVYTAQGAAASTARAAQPPIALESAARPGQRVGDAYGRTVVTQGTFEPQTQLVLPIPGGGFRVLTGLRQPDGSLLPVVRGTVQAIPAPAPPTGPHQLSGIFLPSEDADAAALPEGQLASVRIPQLAQVWTGPLIEGYLVLGADQPAAAGLAPAPVDLPEARGRLRNAAYALQWWVFAAFTLVMAVRMARDFGRRDLVDGEPATPADLPDRD